jgi:ATP-binding cassette subfamily B protein
MLRRLTHYWQSAKREMLTGGTILGFATLVELAQPWPVKWLVDYVFGNQPAPAWLASLWPAFAEHQMASSITFVCGAILGLAVLHRLGVMGGNFFLLRAGARVVQQLRCHAFDQLHRLSVAYHDRTKIGDSLYRVAYDAHAAQTLLNGALVPMATGLLVLIGAIILMLQINVALTFVTLAVTPAFFVIIRAFGGRIDQQSKQYHESESALVASVQESLAAIRAIQAFTLEPETRQRFSEQSECSLRASQRLTRSQLAFGACAGLAVALGTAAVVWVASRQAMQGRMSVGDILVFLAYLGMLYQPMNTFSQSAGVIQAARAQLRRVFEIIDAVPDITDRPEARDLTTVRGVIEFRDVAFHYSPDQPVLRGINLKVEPGQVVAIVGKTGAGKTTMASLLLRFYDPTQGALLLDGQDFREIKIASLRQQVSVVLQDPILFAATIGENIAYGRPGATMSEIQEAARRAQADEFIRTLPHGYQTLLGERGVNLSGGQRQRLSIARAFLKNAPILILDEPTSALDSQTEQALLTCLRELMHGRTTFVIAHRLSTVRDASQIVVLEAGEIVEQGTHDELLRRDTRYARMYQAQWAKSGGTETTTLAMAAASD